MSLVNLLPILLFLLYSPHIKGDKGTEKAIEELKMMVQTQTGLIKALTEMVQNQEQKINDLRKSLEERLVDQDLKIEWALTEGTLAPKKTSGIMKNLARQEKKIDESMTMLRELYNCTTGCQMPPTNTPGNCAEIDGGSAQGVHQIYPDNEHPISARCEKSAGGGWTVIQKRFDGSVDFYRDWEEYAEGFGDPAGEYWLGLRHIYDLTQAQPMELYVGVTDFQLGLRYAKFATFSVSSEEEKFKLNIGAYSGNAGDSLQDHNGQKFSTKDQDNDGAPSSHCSKSKHGGWWYKSCYKSNLNGLFSSEAKTNGAKNMNWYHLHNAWTAMKATVMMIRPANFTPNN